MAAPADSRPAPQPQLAAVVFTDVVGYSARMQRDEASTIARVQADIERIRALCQSNGGEVLNTMGDGVMLCFGSVVQAVSFALQMQKEFAERNDAVPPGDRLEHRVGVHLGDLFRLDGGQVAGDGVNIAARLESGAPPGGICISQTVYDTVKGKVAMRATCAGPQRFKNIAEPIPVWHLAAGDSRAPADAPGPLAGIELSLPDKPSIAVLAFANMSGDPEQEYFTDGITEDIITELSRFQSLFVIARNSSFTYKGRAVDVKQVGRELGVRYVVEGSIRRAGDRVRVTAQLIDSLTGAHLWAEKYDRVVEDIFALQEEVTACIVSAVAPQVDASESLRARRRPGNLSAYELAVKAYALSWDGQQKGDVQARDQALRLAREALALDPDSVLALITIAFAQWQHVLLLTCTDVQAAWQEGMACAERAIELAPASSVAHNAKAFLLLHCPAGPRTQEARIEVDQAYRLNPQDSFTAAGCGFIHAVTGDAAEGIWILERVLRMNPRDPYAFMTYANLATACLVTGDYRRGMEWALLCRTAAPALAANLLTQSALHVGLGQIQEAREAFGAASKAAPGFVKGRMQYQPVPSDPPFRSRVQTFLRIAAGLEEPGAAEG